MAIRNNIVLRLGVDGARAVTQALQTVQQVGQRVMNALRNQGSRLRENLGNLRISIRELGGAMGRVATRIRTAFRGVAGAATAAGTAIGAAFVGAAGSVANQEKDLRRAAKLTGMTFDEIQVLAAAAKNKAGMELDEFVDVYKDFSVRLGEARDGEATPIEGFAMLGLGEDFYNSNRRSIDLFYEYADAVRRTRNIEARNFSIDAVLSDAGIQALPMLLEGAEGIRKIGEEARKTGQIISDEDLDRAHAYNDAVKSLKNSINGIWTTMGTSALPAVSAVAQRLDEVLKGNRDLIETGIGQSLERVKAIAIDLEGVLLRGQVAETTFVQNLLAGIAGARDALSKLSGIVDVVHAVLSDLWAELNGERAQNGTIHQIAEDARWLRDVMVNEVGPAIRSFVDDYARPVFETLHAVLAAVAEAYNRTIGALTDTKVTPEQLAVYLTVAKLLGLFGLIGPAVSVIMSAFGALWSVVGPVLASMLAGLRGIGGLLGMGGVIARGLIFIGDLVLKLRMAVLALMLAASLNPFTIAVAGIVVLVAAVAAAVAAIVIYWDEIKAAGIAAWDAISAFVGDVWAQIVAGLEAIWSGVADGGSAAWNAVAEYASGAFESLVSGITDLFDGLWAGFREKASAALDWLRQKWSSVKAAIGIDGDGPGQAALPAFAGGGGVNGPGTGTSDSILARLSNGEFVIRAAAVKRYGTALFAALNSMSLPKFATGGYVGAAVPAAVPLAFSGAGGSGGRNLTLSLDGREFGVSASDDVLDGLERAIRRRGTSKAQTKPSWFT